MNSFVLLVLARLRSFWREPSVLFWAFGFPMVLAIALGIAFRNRPPEPVTIALEPSCPSIQSDELFVKRAAREDAEKMVRTGSIALAALCDDTGTTYRFDPTRPDARLARLLVHDAFEKNAGRVDRTTPASSFVTEPGARYIDFLVPGLIGSNMMSAGLWGLGFTLVDMRVRNLLKRLAATPMRKIDFLGSFVAVRVILLFVELPVLLVFARLAFGVHIFGSIPLLACVCVLGTLVFSGFGLLVSARAKNTQTVSGLINLVSMPMYLCSGVFFSADRFPDSLQPFVHALPLTALLDAMRAIMTEGRGITEIVPQLVIMLIWGAAVFALSLRAFRWR